MEAIPSGHPTSAEKAQLVYFRDNSSLVVLKRIPEYFLSRIRSAGCAWEPADEELHIYPLGDSSVEGVSGKDMMVITNSRLFSLLWDRPIDYYYFMPFGKIAITFKDKRKSEMLSEVKVTCCKCGNVVYEKTVYCRSLFCPPVCRNCYGEPLSSSTLQDIRPMER
jgi:hypothetical protein